MNFINSIIIKLIPFVLYNFIDIDLPMKYNSGQLKIKEEKTTL